MKNKLVINCRFGGFGLSDAAIVRLIQLGSQYARMRTLEEVAEWPGGGALYCEHDIPRHDKLLVQVVEELGDKASGNSAKLCVVEIDGNEYAVDEYDGQETVDTPDCKREWIRIE